jgi:hypothetical protein
MPYIVQDDLREHAMWTKQGGDLDRGGTLLTLRDSLEKFSEIIQIRRQDYLIIRAGNQLEHGYPNDMADNLRINHNNMPVHRGLKNQPAVIIFHDLEIGIK